MKRILFFCMGAALATGLSFTNPGFSRADPAITADDFIEFFAKDKAALAEHKKTRKVCFSDNDPDPDCQPPKPRPKDLKVTFEFGSDVLTKNAKETLSQLAIALKSPRLDDVKFDIDGHTDATGRADYNKELSTRRAKSVVSYLVGKGVDQSRLDAKGFGQSQPAVADPFAPQNRRVEAHLAP